jgi:hypothetical protein
MTFRQLEWPLGASECREAIIGELLACRSAESKGVLRAVLVRQDDAWRLAS